MTGLQKLSKELMGERCFRVSASGLYACVTVRQEKHDVRIRLSTCGHLGDAIGFTT